MLDHGMPAVSGSSRSQPLMELQQMHSLPIIPYVRTSCIKDCLIMVSTTELVQVLQDIDSSSMRMTPAPEA